MERYKDRIPRKARTDFMVLTTGGFENRLRLAATIYTLLSVTETKQSQTPASAPDRRFAVPQQKPSILEELIADRNALTQYHQCRGYQREAYLDLYRDLLVLKSQAPHLVAMLPEKRSLDDLCFWQQLGWIINEQTYLGQPLDGFAQLPPEHRRIVALCSCESIVEKMREDNAPFRSVMNEWSTTFEPIRDLFQMATRLTSRSVMRRAINRG
jgi:hypothetical protein